MKTSHKNTWIIFLVVAILGIGAFVYFTWPNNNYSTNTTVGSEINETPNNTSVRSSTDMADKGAIQDSAWSWKYVDLANGTKSTPPKEGGDYLLTFDTASKVVATTDCGVLLGSFQTDSVSDLTLRSFTQGMPKVCSKTSLQSTYQSLLTQTDTYSISNNELRLNLKDGSVMVFARQYAEK